MAERLTVQDLTLALVNTGVINLVPERKILASGRSSCLYFNVGDLIMSFPGEKDLVVSALVQTYRDSGRRVDRLVGVPEGVNCLASSLSDRLRIGQLRIRENKAEHGVQQRIEGNYSVGQTVAVFEDVLSTGRSTEKRAIDPLRTVNLRPNIVIALIDREYGGMARIKDKLCIPAFAFTTTTEIADELIRSSALNDQQIRLLREELEELRELR